MSCTTNTCSWTFDKELNEFACSDEPPDSTCSLGLTFIEPESASDAGLVALIGVIKQAAEEIVAKIPANKNPHFKPTFLINNTNAVVLLEMKKNTPNATFIKAAPETADETLVKAANDIQRAAENIAGESGSVPPNPTPTFVLKEEGHVIKLAWVLHGESAGSTPYAQ